MTQVIESPASRLMRLLDSFITTQLLYVAAKLGIAAHLRDGPRSGAELAQLVGADPDALTRVLRGLAAEDVLDEDADGRFSLSPVGRALEALHGAAVGRGDLYFRSAEGLLDVVRQGGTAFEHMYGERFFEHLDHHAAHQAAFEGSTAGRAEQEARDVVAAYDFSGIRRLVDVGGGRGVLLAAILEAVPDMRSVLGDREPVIPHAREFLGRAGVGDRATCAAVDFFASVPAGADAYLLSRVLHDWDDADARRILENCRRAMHPGSRLLVVEAILPERARDAPAVIRMDLHMLLLLGSRERTQKQFGELLGGAGFKVEGLAMTASPAGLGVITASP